MSDSKPRNWLADLAALPPGSLSNALTGSPYSNALADLLKALPPQPKTPSMAEILSALDSDPPGGLFSFGNSLGASGAFPTGLINRAGAQSENPLIPSRTGLINRAATQPGNPLIPSSLLDQAALDDYRSRSSWNDRFTHWEKPASVSEDGTIERAQYNVVRALSSNSWLVGQGVRICCQGSYQNKTNVRTEADVDLRAAHPGVRVDYAPSVVEHIARSTLAYSDHGLTLQQTFDTMRSQIITTFAGAFGRGNVLTDGKKAIRIKGITGSRAKVDVVPTVQYHHVSWKEAERRYGVVEGVAILSTDGRWTLNYPDQHEDNGIAKRTRTAYRFKRIVRIFKRLRADMADRGLLTVAVPSFLVECLVYAVEDGYFLVDRDDRYDRVRRIALRMRELLTKWPSALTEINGIKPLFGPEQGWTRESALTFVNAAIRHLGDA